MKRTLVSSKLCRWVEWNFQDSCIRFETDHGVKTAPFEYIYIYRYTHIHVYYLPLMGISIVKFL